MISCPIYSFRPTPLSRVSIDEQVLIGELLVDYDTQIPIGMIGFIEQVSARYELETLFPILLARPALRLAHLLTIFARQLNINFVQPRAVAHDQQVFTGRELQLHNEPGAEGKQNAPYDTAEQVKWTVVGMTATD
jgi:hypothetical protein